jgi:hypothetical protein
MLDDSQVYRELGLKRLSAIWAKCEILLGLLAATLGLSAVVTPPEFVGGLGVPGYIGGVSLVVLGTYLAMAGHRSHLYQSQNRLFAWLAMRIDGHKECA